MNESGAFRIGNQTAFAAGSLMAPFEFAIAQGFSAFEFFPDRGPAGVGGWDERELDAGTRSWIRQTAQGRDIRLSVHAPLTIEVLRHPNDARLYSSIEFAVDIGARLLNLHLETAAGLDRFVEAIGPALRLTADAGIQLALENTVFTGPNDFNECFALLGRRREYPSAHAGMTLDLGHANLYSELRNNYWRYFDCLQAQVPLLHLHLHENYGDRDSHLTLFTGPAGQDVSGVTGFLERLQRRNFRGCAILEQWPDPPSLLVQARDRLLALASARSTLPQTAPDLT